MFEKHEDIRKQNEWIYKNNRHVQKQLDTEGKRVLYSDIIDFAVFPTLT